MPQSAARVARDHALLDQVAAGRRQALMRLYDAYADEWLATASRQVGPGSDAEELLCDLFLDIWRGARPPRRLRPWGHGRLRAMARALLLQAPEIADQIHPDGPLDAPQPAPPLLRDLLLHATGEISRLAPFAATVRRWTRLPRTRVATLLLDMDNPGRWQAQADGRFAHWVPCDARGARFVRLGGGQPLCQAARGGCNLLLVLQGRCQDAAGRIYAAGCTLDLADGDPQPLRALAGPPLLGLLAASRRRRQTPAAGRGGRASVPAAPWPA